MRARVMSAGLVAILLVAQPATANAGRSPIGFHDTHEGTSSDVDCVAAGWAVDPDDPATEVAVRVIADGTEVASGIADRPRSDVREAGFDTDDESGWAFDLTDVLAATGAHEILVQAQDLETSEWHDLGASPRTLTCTGLGGFHDAFSGLVNRSECAAAGWAWDRHNPEGPRVTVRVLVDGSEVAQVVADELREDVRDAGIGDGYSGWSIDLWPFVVPDTTHAIRVEAQDVDQAGIWMALAATDRDLTCQDGSDAIFVRDLRTGIERQVTTLPDTGEYNPAVSPNLSTVAHDVVGGDVGHAIWLTTIATGLSTPLAGADGGNDAAWSGDGSRIAFDTLPLDDPRVWIVQSSGGTAAPVAADASDADWHPGGRMLVFVREATNDLVVLDLATRTEWSLVTLATDVPSDWFQRAISGINPSWAPDGRSITYGDGGDLFRVQVSADGTAMGAPVRLTSTGAFENGATWAPDGRSIVFKSDLTGDFAIWRMPAGGGSPTLLADLPGIGDYDADVATNGHQLVYTHAAVDPPSLFGENLLVNGDAELGDASADGTSPVAIPGWSTAGAVTVVAYGTPDPSGLPPFPSQSDPGPDARGANFFAGGPSSLVSTASQEVLVGGAAARIDQGRVRYRISGYFGGWLDQEDTATMRITFMRGSEVLGVVETSAVTAGLRGFATGMLERNRTGYVPVGTRRILVTLTLTKDPTVGAYNDGYADNLSLTLSR